MRFAFGKTPRGPRSELRVRVAGQATSGNESVVCSCFESNLLENTFYRGVSTSICRAIKKQIRGAICFLSADNARNFYHVGSPLINDANNSILFDFIAV